jgi:hypothetical protein
VTGKNTEKTVAVTSFDLFEGRLLNFTEYLVFLFSSSLLIEGDRFRLDGEIDGELFEAASLFDSEKARHTETNKLLKIQGPLSALNHFKVGCWVLLYYSFYRSVLR